MAHQKQSLYRWDKFTKPKARVYSRSQHVTSDGDIQAWIKKVEVASDLAAAEAFSPESYDFKRSRNIATTTIENLHQHESAHQEARDLLQQWMSSATEDPLGEEEEFAESPLFSKTRTQIKREWDSMVEQNEDEYGLDLDLERIAQKKKSVFSQYETDNDVLVDDIMQNLLAKPLVPKRKIKKLFTDKKKIDPATKMQMRQQQVKENRERRMKQVESKHRELQAKKDVEFQARQLVKKEEQKKQMQVKKEEEDIERHMAAIRRQMEEEKKKKLSEKHENQESARRIEDEYQTLLQMELAQKRQARLEDEARRRKIALKLQQVEARQATENLKLQHSCFTAWYQLVIERRLQMGKAAAMCDWKLTLHHWNAWRSYTRTRQLERDTQLHQEHIKDTHRKKRAAENHYKHTLLRKCLLAWQLYIAQHYQDEAIQQSQHATRSKMAAFLEAASRMGTNVHRSQSLTNIAEHQDELSEFFKPQSPTGQHGSDGRRTQSARSGQGRKGSHPKAAWQLNRNDILRPEDLLFREQGGSGGEGQTDGRTSASGSGRAWEKAPYRANSFQHRHKAQQKILEQQQQQLKEQQRLLEELQYLQRQQLLQQQLTQGQEITDPTNKHTGAAMQKHLDQLKQDLVASGVDVTQVHGNGDGAKISTVKTAGQVANITETDRKCTGVQKTDRQADTARTDGRTDTGRTDVSAGSKDTTRTATSNTSGRHQKFIHTMEERAAERARLKKEREEKRQKAEAEKLAQLEAEQAERLRQEEEAKQARIEAHREKKRLEKQQQLEKERQQEKLRQQMAIAEEHSRLALMKYRGWLPWRMLITMAAERRKKAEQHYMTCLLRKCLLSWHQIVRQEIGEKEALADDLFSHLLLRRCFGNWKKVGECLAIQEEKAQRFHDSRLKLRFLRAWAEYTEDEKMAMWRKERQAREHDVTRIKKKYFHVLRYFPEIIKEQKEKEKRREELRKKVASLLPDFEGGPVRPVVSESFD